MHYFVINYREIEVNKTLSKVSKELYIGLLDHSDTYVISSKAPEYKKEELQLRALCSSYSDVIAGTIE